MEDICSKAVAFFMEEVQKMILRQKLIQFVIQDIRGLPMFMSGSRAECIQGLDSDTDIIYESTTVKATVSTERARLLKDRYLENTLPLKRVQYNYYAIVVMDTMDIHPGYTKVKVFDIKQNTSQTTIDVKSLCFDDTEYVSSAQTSQYWKDKIAQGHIFPFRGMHTKFQPHGPCIKFQFGGLEQIHEIDTLFSLKCDWPVAADEWLTRRCEHQWPDLKTIEKIQSMGCSLVPIGHADSPEKHLEWRISFNKAERELVWSFNGTQYACIYFMKIFFHAKIRPKFPDVFPSYFIKTAIFWLIEKSPTDFWKPENLHMCLEKLLEQIITCVAKKEVQNYFIPENNMIDTRSTMRLEQLHSELLIYEKLGPTKWRDVIKMRIEEKDENDVYVHHVEINSLCNVRHISLNVLNTLESDTFSARLEHINEKLKQAKGKGLFQNSCLLLQQEIGTFLSIHNFQRSFSENDATKEGDALQTSLETLADTSFCCGRLMLATYHLYLKRFNEAQGIAADVIRGYNNTIVHYSFYNRDKTPKDEDFVEMFRQKTSSFRETLKHFIAFDVVCPPLLTQFYPEAVQSAMSKFNEVLFINPLFYAYVLHLHCSIELGNSIRTSKVVDDLVSFMEKNSKTFRQTRDFPLCYITGKCLHLVGRTEKGNEYMTMGFEGKHTTALLILI
ncbi:uncharacterized protein LOC132549318 [Ylistrum balloti]|uniref:uncharacterized protein LOC132549318 n=1 Tax=Ylistrum balloti TaxID=509963 RepID=UPI0029059D43|nr:uncharacterized protein LOC132549318 [Ylistrum balloti]